MRRAEKKIKGKEIRRKKTDADGVEMSMHGLENLETWQKARQLSLLIYREITTKFPDDEKWGLRSQVSRAAISIPANIAEGYGRYYFQENIRFCYQARGSLDELYSHMVIANDLNYITKNEFDLVSAKINELRQMLNGYIRYLRDKKSQIGEKSDQSYTTKSEPEYPT